MKDFQDLSQKRIYWREGEEEIWDIYFFINSCLCLLSYDIW